MKEEKKPDLILEQCICGGYWLCNGSKQPINAGGHNHEVIFEFNPILSRLQEQIKE